MTQALVVSGATPSTSTFRATRRSSAVELVAPVRSCEADCSFGGLIQTADAAWVVGAASARIAHTHPENPLSPCAVHALKLRVLPMLTRRRGSGTVGGVVVAIKCFVEDSERFIEQVCRTA